MVDQMNEMMRIPIGRGTGGSWGRVKAVIKQMGLRCFETSLGPDAWATLAPRCDVLYIWCMYRAAAGGIL
jgi:hypothetical protein